MPETEYQFIWSHQSHGELGVYSDIDILIKAAVKAPYPVPNIQKLKQEMEQHNKFEYGMGLLTIVKVLIEEEL